MNPHGGTDWWNRGRRFLREHGVIALLLLVARRAWARPHCTWRRWTRTLRTRVGWTGPVEILVIEDRVPATEEGRGFGRAVALLKALIDLGYRVNLLPTDSRSGTQAQVRALRRMGVRIVSQFRRPEHAIKAHAGLYDVVIACRPHNFSRCRQTIRKYHRNSFLIYDSEALYFVREQLKAAVFGTTAESGATLRSLEREELDLIRSADYVLAASQLEKGLIEEGVPEVGRNVSVWAYPVAAVPTLAPFGARQGLLFVGAFDPSSPNGDAVNFFLKAIWPAVSARLTCRFRIVGRVTADLAAWSSGTVELPGFVDDLDPYYDGARVSVVPHRYAAGLSVKLLEAMSRGVPAVVSELIAGQLGLSDGVEVLVARTPGEFVEKVVALHSDEGLWCRLREGALRYVDEHCNPTLMREALRKVIDGRPTAGPLGRSSKGVA